jgi:hypothetical protein
VAIPPQVALRATSEDLSARLCVQAQALIREVNEQIHQLGAKWETDAGVCSIVCECANPECLAPLKIPSTLYAEVRRFPTRFVLLPDHVTQAFQRLVEQAPDYVVIEIFGPAAAAAIRQNPRAGVRPDEGTRRDD